MTDTQGCEPSDVETLAESARPHLEHCRGSSGGKLIVNVRKQPGGKLAFDVLPGTTLDPTERDCALDALKRLDVNESSTAWTGGASFPPTGFTSLLTVEW